MNSFDQPEGFGHWDKTPPLPQPRARAVYDSIDTSVYTLNSPTPEFISEINCNVFPGLSQVAQFKARLFTRLLCFLDFYDIVRHLHCPSRYG